VTVAIEKENVGLPALHLDRGTRAANLRPLLEQPAVVARIRADRVPIPTPRQRIRYYGDDHLGYWLSGLADLRRLRGLIGPDLRGPVLDFGAATGRVARHWSREPEGFEVVACELTGRMVAWMQRHLEGAVTAHQTGPLPPLPFPDARFGLIYAYSVFTHIDAAEEAWLDELARLAAPGGRVALTVHNDDTWAALPTLDWRIRDELAQIPEFVTMRAADPRPPGRVCFERGGVRYVFHSDAHIRAVWGARFEILAILPGFHNYQTMVLMAPR
jgi:SAM-dependent methyltransferase